MKKNTIFKEVLISVLIDLGLNPEEDSFIKAPNYCEMLAHQNTAEVDSFSLKQMKDLIRKHGYRYGATLALLYFDYVETVNNGPAYLTLRLLIENKK